MRYMTVKSSTEQMYIPIGILYININFDVNFLTNEAKQVWLYSPDIYNHFLYLIAIPFLPA